MSARGLEAARPAGTESGARLAAARVAVLQGGTSSEREVSLSSGSEVLRALAVADGQGPRSVLSIEIEPQGRWRVGAESLDPLRALLSTSEVDIFFLALHGGSGEDGTLQGLLESAGRAYTGSGVRASALCMDKLATRGLAAAHGLRTAAGLCLGAAEYARDPTRALERVARAGAGGLVLKPRCGGSSVATFVVDAGGPLRAAVEAVLATGDDCLVEQRVEGVECSCGVLGNRGEEPRPLPPVEIRPAPGRFFDYQQKYAQGGAEELCPPVSLSSAAVERVQSRACSFYRAAGCDGYARIDFIVPADGEPVLLEANTLPGFTSRSLLPKEAAAAGLDYRGLCLYVLDAALRRWGSAP